MKFWKFCKSTQGLEVTSEKGDGYFLYHNEVFFNDFL